MAAIGVFPVYEIEFKVSTTGKVSPLDATAYASMSKVAEIETFDLSIDGNVETWTPTELDGWVRRLMTGKGFVVSCAGKRNDQDAGNNYIAGKALATGRGCTTSVGIKFPNGDHLLFNAVVNVSKDFGGDSTNVSALEFELQSDGKPVYVPA